LDDLLPLPARIIPVLFLGLLVRRAFPNDDIGPGAVRVVLAALLQDEALARGPGRHDALTQLTAEHGNEPMDGPSGWLMSQKGCTPPWGADQRNAAPDRRDQGGENYKPSKTKLPVNSLADLKGRGASRKNRSSAGGAPEAA
jgi:hypothetical protein